MQTIPAEKTLDVLRKRICFDLSLNDLRIMVGCFRAVAYLMDTDGETYLDADAIELQKSLERRYGELLEHKEYGWSS